ncbi:MAG: 4-hydroxy-tetrahydrodipicolinate reductase [Leptospiraceae bacterium]|nr:4-hydroxy-tetrahydrodipicolinate reductase [Leptospiraceae bacterium]
MGRAITERLSVSHNAFLKYAVDRESAIFLGMDSGLYSGIQSNGVLYTSDIEEGIKNSDAVIDFSASANLKQVISSCVKFKKPVVVGVTGLTETQKLELKNASNSIPILFSPNMSIGVNLLFKLVQLAAGVLKDEFDIEILDIHHRHKKDSPSGTAQKLKEILLSTLNRTEENVIYGREGIYEEREKKEIGIHSMRAGEVVGDHTVSFFSAEEIIEVKHSAKDRKTFAVGAVRAAEFLVGKSTGFFDMYDVLGIE